MIVKEFDYIKGNTVVKPERRYTDEDKRKYEELERAKRQRRRRKKEEEKKKVRGIIQVALIFFVFGIITILRDNNVMRLQRDVNELNSQVKLATAENEAIRVQLLKFASLDNIKTNAEERLGMTLHTKDDVVKIDLSKNYFADLEAELETENNESDNKGLFSKIMDVIN